jgi:hypothetical protein
MFCGHLHIDALLPLFNTKSHRHGYVMAAPGLSARNDNNPAFRVIRLSGGRPVDYDQYFADIIANPAEPVWRLEYSFRQFYAAKDLSEAELDRLVRALLSNSTLMWRYRRMMLVSNYDARPFHFCTLSAKSRDDLDRCIAQSPERVGNPI